MPVGGQRRIATTAPGLVGCRRQLGRDPFAGPGGCCCQMPCPGNYIALRIAGRREGPVGLPPLDRGRGVVDRGPDEWVEEP
ncbi:MAG TPA: hypothetical protein VHU77_07940, partial [Candidatus Limnocylindria bacterium]|nr:hypothetical protein [Candidatus Limnocylindria bacterium]